MWVDVLQNTDEWHELRRGVVTASNFPKIMANYGKAFGNPAKEYAQKKALERVTGEIDDSSSYRNTYMDRGNELEPIARMLYEEQTLNFVSNGGFYKDGNLGDSPDGLIGSKGMIEIKSVIANTQWKRLKSNKYDTSYQAQIQGHLLLSGREWCDFVSYCPEMNEKNRLFVYRAYPDREYFEMLSKRLLEFEKEIVKNIEILTK